MMMQNSFSAARFLQVRLNHHDKPSNSLEGGVKELLVKKVMSYPPQSIGRRVANRGLMRRGPLATPVE